MRKLAFSSRAEYRNWRSYNCNKCKKAWTPKSKDFIGDCPIEFLLDTSQRITEEQIKITNIGTQERCSLFEARTDE